MNCRRWTFCTNTILISLTFVSAENLFRSIKTQQHSGVITVQNSNLFMLIKMHIHRMLWEWRVNARIDTYTPCVEKCRNANVNQNIWRYASTHANTNAKLVYFTGNKWWTNFRKIKMFKCFTISFHVYSIEIMFAIFAL